MVRNRLRRRLRAIVGDREAGLRAGAYLVTVAPAAAGLSFGELRTAVMSALAALPAAPVPAVPVPGTGVAGAVPARPS